MNNLNQHPPGLVIGEITQLQQQAEIYAMSSAAQSAIQAAMNQLNQQIHITPPSIQDQIAAVRQQLKDLEDQEIKSMAPTSHQMETYPALKEAWDEWMTIRTLTLGAK